METTLEKLPFEPVDIEARSPDGETTSLTVTRAETREDLLNVPRLEEAHLFESRKWDCGYVYNDDEVLELHEVGEFFLIHSPVELIGYCAVIFGEAANRKIATREGDAYYGGSVLKPEWRRQGVSKELNELREKRARLYGASRLICCMVANNRGSIASLGKAGLVISNAINDVFPYDENDVVNGDRLVMTKDLEDVSNASQDPKKVLPISLEYASEVFDGVQALIKAGRRIVHQRISSINNLILIDYI